MFQFLFVAVIFVAEGKETQNDTQDSDGHQFNKKSQAHGYQPASSKYIKFFPLQLFNAEILRKFLQLLLNLFSSLLS